MIKNFIFALAIFIAFIFNGCGGGGSDSSSNNNNDNGNPSSNRIKWSYNVGEKTFIYYSSVALSPDNQTLYFGTSKNVREISSGSDKLIALNRDGTLKWQYDLTNGEEVRSDPVAIDGKVLFIADRRTGQYEKDYSDLFCINSSNGSLEWKQRISDNKNMSGSGKTAVVVKNNKVFAVMKNIFVFDINSGNELYKSTSSSYQISDDTYINPIINNTKMLFMLYNNLYLFDIENYTITTVDLGTITTSEVLSTIAVDSSDNIYFGTENGEIISLDSAYNLRWKYKLTKDEHGPFFRSSPAIDEINGNLYIGTKHDDLSKFLAIKLSTGELSWSIDIQGDIYSSPTIGNNGNIYFGSESRKVYSVNPNGTIVWTVNVGQDMTWPSPTIDNEGIIYIGGMGDGDGKGNGKIYAIQTDSTGLSTGIWPTIHKNSQNNAIK